MLFQILDHIQKEGWVSSQQLCRHFSLDYSALEPMLDLLQQKGFIKAQQPGSGCAKKCVQCSPESITYFQPT